MHPSNRSLRRSIDTLRNGLYEYLSTSNMLHSMKCTLRITLYVVILTLYELHATKAPLRRIYSTLRNLPFESLSTLLNLHSTKCILRLAVYVGYVSLYEMHPTKSLYVKTLALYDCSSRKTPLRELWCFLRNAFYETQSTL